MATLESWNILWRIAGESRKYGNTCKCVGSLAWIRIVNRRPDDECQRVCGVYRSVDEGQQVQVIRTQVTGIW